MIKSHLIPGGLELQVEDAKNNLLYRVSSKATRPQRYFIHSLVKPETPPLEIRPLPVGETRRYKLLENGAELLSLQQSSSPGDFFVNDGQHNIIARFIPVTSMKILLRSSTRVVARLRILKYPPPAGFRIVCDVETYNQWILAIIMYAVALIQEVKIQPVSSEDRKNTP